MDLEPTLGLQIGVAVAAAAALYGIAFLKTTWWRRRRRTIERWDGGRSPPRADGVPGRDA